MHRRPLVCVMSSQTYEYNALPGRARVKLGRRTKDDLLLAAVLAPLAVSELDAPVDERIFALDASLQWGAICQSKTTAEIAGALWVVGEKQGG